MSPRGRIWRFGGVGRRPDHWSSPHERARIRAAERLDQPLSSREEAWLESHLATCEPCRAIAEAYAADRLWLHRLRDDPPEPPRDLWARTAAGIEREAAGRRPTARPARARRATSLPALGALSGLAVVGVVVVATAISSGLLGRPGRDPLASPPVALASPPIALPTAMAVGAGRVHWLGAGADGDFAYNVADIDVVCPYDRQPDCAPFADGNARRVSLATTPRYVYQSPIDNVAVVVGSDAGGADAVLVVALPAPEPAPVATAGVSPATSTEPSGATASTSSLPSGATPSIDLPSVTPSEAPSISLASIDPAASGLLSPLPSDAVAVAILTDVAIVGRAAAYSSDGSWFAFSARPADGSVGPDIYVWHVGDVEARALTADHASVFASWVGGSLLGSRASQTLAAPVDPSSPSASPELPASSDGSATPEASPAVEASPAPEFLPQTFLLDPATGLETPLLEAEWQPAVDPTGLAVVSWRGTVAMAGDGLTAGPATGNLVIHPFRGAVASESPEVLSSLSPEASSTPSPNASTDGSPSPSPAPQVVRDFPEQIVTAGPVADFDARWDDTGSWLAIWIADPIDPGLGRLSLLHFDPFTGLLDRPSGAPQDVTALPGFSIGLGRLAWASPPGQGGEGSRIQIAAWISNEVGAVESIPVEHAIIVQ